MILLIPLRVSMAGYFGMPINERRKHPQLNFMEKGHAWIVKGVVALAIATMAISAFFTLVGLPYSYTSVAEECSIGNQCVQTTQSGSSFVPAQIAVIPLLLGGLVAVGAVVRRASVTWTGVVGLLAFSFISLVSLGILYLPLVIALVGLTAAATSNQSWTRKIAQGQTAQN